MAKRVLILHDDPERRTEYCKILWYNGFDVEVVDDPEQARAAAAKTTPDLVLLGLSRSSTRAFDLCRELSRMGGDARAMPVIVLTRQLDLDRARAARRGGCTSYLEEPIPPVEVLFAVERLIGRVVPGEETEGSTAACDPVASPLEDHLASETAPASGTAAAAGTAGSPDAIARGNTLDSIARAEARAPSAPIGIAADPAGTGAPAPESASLRVVVEPPLPPLRAVEARPESPPPGSSDPPPTLDRPAGGLTPEPPSGA